MGRRVILENVREGFTDIWTEEWITWGRVVLGKKAKKWKDPKLGTSSECLRKSDQANGNGADWARARKVSEEVER